MERKKLGKLLLFIWIILLILFIIIQILLIHGYLQGYEIIQIVIGFFFAVSFFGFLIIKFGIEFFSSFDIIKIKKERRKIKPNWKINLIIGLVLLFLMLLIFLVII